MIGRLGSTWILALVLAILGWSGSADALQCYECASPQLKTNWALIGYPKALSKGFYHTDCEITLIADPANDAKLTKVECPSFCVSVFVHAIDDTGKMINKDTYWVARGCYDTFMTGADKKETTSLPNPASAAASSKSRAIGVITSFTQDWTSQKTAYNILSCIGVADAKNTPCNNEAVSTVFPGTCDTTTAANPCVDTSGQSNVKCSQYPSKSESTCNGNYCIKNDFWSYGQRMVGKTCATTNPYIPPGTAGFTGNSKTTQCTWGENKAFVAPYGTSYNKYTDCYCNDRDYCNGASIASVSGLAIVTMGALVLFGGRMFS